MRKVDWARVGRVTEPGRYMMRFGYVIVTADDLEIWKKYPQAVIHAGAAVLGRRHGRVPPRRVRRISGWG